MDIGFNLLPKQGAYFEATQRYVMYSGAIGAAKSYALAVKLFCRALRPGARELLLRKRGADLRRSTLRTLLEGDGPTPPIIPAGLYEHNKTERCIRLNQGGVIDYTGLDEPNQLGSTQYTGAHLEEAQEFDAFECNQIDGRVRLRVEGLPLQLNGACNPQGPLHWIAERWGLSTAYPTPWPDHFAVKARTEDNPYLPPETVAAWRRNYSGAYAQRMLDGLWVGADGLVYDCFDPARHVTKEAPQAARVLVLVDDGTTEPCVVLRVLVDSDGRMHVAEEWAETGTYLDDRVSAVRRLGGAGATIVYDSAASTLGAELRRNFPAVVASDKATLKVREGVQLVRRRLQPDQEGRPRLTVDPSCRTTIAEFGSYEWKTDRSGTAFDEPKDENNHAMDALRYGVMYLDNRVAVEMKELTSGIGVRRYDARDRGLWTTWR